MPKFLSILIIFTSVIQMSCRKDGVPNEKHLIYEENFAVAGDWIITGEVDTSVEPGEADGEIKNNQLYLHADGCTEVIATLDIANTNLDSFSSDKATIVVAIDEFRPSTKASSANAIRIVFGGINLSIKPKKQIIREQFVFRFKAGDINIEDKTDLIDYSIGTANESNKISVTLQSEGEGDCVASASMRLGEISVYSK